MGDIRKRLGDIATYFDKEQLAVRCQLEYVGEAIESEFKKLQDKIEALDKNVLESLRKQWKRLYSFEACIKALEKIHPFSLQDHRHTEKEFQVGDTVAFDYDGGIRIVLEINPDTFKMKLMNIPSGRIQTECPPENYTFVYRPGQSKPVSTVKEEIATDKDGKPSGGLKAGDVLEYNSPCYAKRMDAIFIEQTSAHRHSGWIQACRVRDGRTVIIDIKLDDCKFKFRPKFPEPKNRQRSTYGDRQQFLQAL